MDFNEKLMRRFVASLYPPLGGGDNGMWRGRAIDLARVALANQPDLSGASVDDIRELFNIEAILAKARAPDSQDARDCGAYLKALPGFPMEALGRGDALIPENPRMQHGFLQLQVGKREVVMEVREAAHILATCPYASPALYALPLSELRAAVEGLVLADEIPHPCPPAAPGWQGRRL